MDKHECKLCAEGMPLKEYLDGSMRHFDGLMAWHPCEAPHEFVATHLPNRPCCSCGWTCGGRMTECEEIWRNKHMAPARDGVRAYKMATAAEVEVATICGHLESGKYRIEVVKALEKRFAAALAAAKEQADGQ
jgi:hypothetical protein